MSAGFKTWAEARNFAQVQANKIGVSYGIEKPAEWKGIPEHMKEWRVFMLPAPQFRFGFEARCEVVDPSIPIMRQQFLPGLGLKKKG